MMMLSIPQSVLSSFLLPRFTKIKMDPASLISVSTVVLDGHRFERGLDLLAEAGAVCVEPAFIEGYMPFDEGTFCEAEGLQLARFLAASGLSVRAVSAHIDLGAPESAEKLRRRLEFARAMGARILITNATTSDRFVQFQKVVTSFLPELAASGMTLALENPGHGSGALFSNATQSAEIVASFGDPCLRMNYDIGNAATYGARTGTAAEDLDVALPFAAHLHLKDLRDVNGDWFFCPVGQGEIGYGAQVALERIPSDFSIGIEHPIRLWRPGHGDPRRRDEVPSEYMVVKAVRSALEFVTNARATLR
jgi:sugar phosphate isomerase/epimerase